MTQIVVLNNISHANVKVFNHEKSLIDSQPHVIELYPSEYEFAARSQPIFFTKDKESGQLKSVVLYGLEPKQNVYVDQDNNWESIYIPLNILSQPFSFSIDHNNTPVLCINANSPYIDNDNGLPLYANNLPTETLNNAASIVNERQKIEATAAKFIQALLQNELLEACTIKALINEKEATFNGLYILNREKLAQVNERLFKELDRLGFTQYINTIINSEQHIGDFIERIKNKT